MSEKYRGFLLNQDKILSEYKRKKNRYGKKKDEDKGSDKSKKISKRV